jgi:fatty acid amide hydrolase
MNETSVTRLDATTIAARIAEGSLTARAVVEAHIARIRAVNGPLNAVVVTRFEEALADADRADAASPVERGPLHGVPVTIKEQFDVAGTPATLGVAGAAAATTDGPLVTRLKAAGAIVLGKTNVPQLLIFNETDNPVYGRTTNPWNPARSCGGSSGGEAAIIAAFGSPLGLGSDIGGSLRTPSHACGISALKPTSGRLSNEDGRAGLFATGQLAILSQPGPMARSVADLDLMMRVLAAPGQASFDPAIAPVPWPVAGGSDVRALRIGIYDDDGFFTSSPSVRRAVGDATAALAALGADCAPFTPPAVAHAMGIYLGLLSADGARGAARRLGGGTRDRRVAGLLQIAALPRALRPLAVGVARGIGGRKLALQVAHIAPQPTDAFWQLVDAQAAYGRAFYAELDRGDFDAIVCPPHALPALTHGSSYFLTLASSYAMLYNLLGMPAGVVPITRVRAGEECAKRRSLDIVERTAHTVERDSAGLPLGVQVVARHWREDIALRVMAALESVFGERTDYPRLPEALA